MTLFAMAVIAYVVYLLFMGIIDNLEYAIEEFEEGEEYNSPEYQAKWGNK